MLFFCPVESPSFPGSLPSHSFPPQWVCVSAVPASVFSDYPLCCQFWKPLMVNMTVQVQEKKPIFISWENSLIIMHNVTKQNIQINTDKQRKHTHTHTCTYTCTCSLSTHSIKQLSEEGTKSSSTKNRERTQFCFESRSFQVDKAIFHLVDLGNYSGADSRFTGPYHRRPTCLSPALPSLHRLRKGSEITPQLRPCKHLCTPQAASGWGCHMRTAHLNLCFPFSALGYLVFFDDCAVIVNMHMSPGSMDKSVQQLKINREKTNTSYNLLQSCGRRVSLQKVYKCLTTS